MSHTVEVHAFIPISEHAHVCGWRTSTFQIVPMPTSDTFIRINDLDYEVMGITILDEVGIEIDAWVINGLYDENEARVVLEEAGFHHIKCCGQAEERILA
jgi:hypothetical protein